MSQNLKDQERHLLVKVIDRVLYKLDTMNSGKSPNIVNENVRNITARVISILASTHGVPALLPFLKITFQPYIENLVESIVHGLEDEKEKICVITTLKIRVVQNHFIQYTNRFWKGIINKHCGKGLAAFLKV
nr:4386_t:CDS:2 [Entrophospora candida]